MGNDKSLLVLGAFQDIYVLAIHNLQLSTKRKEGKFLTYLPSECLTGDKVLVRNHARDVGD